MNEEWEERLIAKILAEERERDRKRRNKRREYYEAKRKKGAKNE